MEVFILIICCILVGSANALDFEREAEGSCASQHLQVSEALNITWARGTKFPYISAGNQYGLYRLATPDPMEHIPEYKFYYEACLKSSIDEKTGDAHVLSYRTKVNRHRVAEVKPGVLEFTDAARNPDSDTSRNYVTLTDNKSFVFFANCWLKADQRSWVVLSTVEVLGMEEVAKIEEHAASLGFNREKFVFLKCVK